MWPSSSGDYSSRRENERDLKLDYFAHAVSDLHRLPRLLREEVLTELPQGIVGFIEEVDNQCHVSRESELKLDCGEVATLESTDGATATPV